MAKGLTDDQNHSDTEAVIKEKTAVEWGSMEVPVQLIPVVDKLIQAFLKAAAFNKK